MTERGTRKTRRGSMCREKKRKKKKKTRKERKQEEQSNPLEVVMSEKVCLLVLRGLKQAEEQVCQREEKKRKRPRKQEEQSNPT